MDTPSSAPDAPQPETSIDLLRRARGGDSDALDRLWRIHRPRLQRWARGRLPGWARNLVDTDDIVQDTLLHTVQRLDGFEPRHSGAFQAYLRQALNNRIRDEIRKVGRRPAGEELRDEHVDQGASPLELAIGEDAMRRYERALERLDGDEQSLIVARIELGLSFVEVAQATDRPTADAARMAVGRALVRLATEMDRE